MASYNPACLLLQILQSKRKKFSWFSVVLYCVAIPHTFSTLVTCFSSYLFMKYSPVHFGNAES